jgi:glycerate kinase
MKGMRNLKVVIAPDSFKESLSASEVANAVEEGFREVFSHAHYVKVPMADGGEGLSLVITGEGKIDNQTIYGKTPVGVAAVAQKYNVPVIGLAGSLGTGYEEVYHRGINTLFSVVPGITTLETALQNAYPNIINTSRNIARALALAPLKTEN